MKKKITALLVGIFALVLNTYAQSPTVTFIGTPNPVCAGQNVVFTNSTTNFPLLWTWYFPGGNPSSWSGITPGNPPPIQYLYTGFYNVTCVVTNASGTDSVTIKNYIIVSPLPKATIIPPSGGICDTGLAGGGKIHSVDDTIKFSVIDTGAGNTYSWAPAGSLSCSTCENPKAFPYITTVYTITVTGHPDGCTIIDHDTVTVGDSAMKAKITGKINICRGQVDTLIASGGSSKPLSTYKWSTGATTSSIIVSPAATTPYSVTIFSGSGHCTSQGTFTVNVFAKPVFTLSNHPDSVCYPGQDTISVSPPIGNPYEYYWYGPSAAPDTTDYFITQPSGSTTYTLVVQNLGCYYDSLIRVKVNSKPVVHLTGATNLCFGQYTIITATGGDYYIWSGSNLHTSSIDVRPPASITYTVEVRNGGCFKDTTFTIIVDTMPKVKFRGDTSICQGQGTTVYVDNGYQYTFLWNTGATSDSIYATYPHTGKFPYYVTVTKGACNVDSAEIIVKVYPRPNPAIYPLDTTVCEFDSVQLTVTGGDYYKWLPKNSGLNHYYYGGDTDRDNAAPFVQTTYTVNVCTWGCCEDTSAIIRIRPNVQGAAVCCNDTVAGGTPVQLSATYNNTGPYQVEGWYPPTGLSCTTCADPIATVYKTTTYVVTFLDNSLSSSCTLQDSVTIDVFNCTIFVPNVFSPGQEVNNILYVRSLCIQSMTFAVFDRYGNKVFETGDQNSGWDGTYKGKPMEMGTYMWYLTGLLRDGTSVLRSGNVTLVR